MAAPTRKFNPGFLTDDELVASYCVRMAEFELLVEVLRDCTRSSNPHQLVIGPRGSGKTTLLPRVAAEVPRDVGLASRCFPVVFAEESYEVATAGEFWLECLTNLADQAPRRENAPDLHRTVDELRAIRGDDRALADRCLGALMNFADREHKRLLLLVENLNMLFRDMADPDEGWRLRKTLQTEPRIIVFASATSRFDEIDHPDRALYDLFRIRTLRPLDTKQCAVLWETVTGRAAAPPTVRSLEILTGGSPRLISIVARFGAGLSFRKLMADLFDLVDDHTEYFKSHIESLPARERRVYLALAALWRPATTREIADQARIGTSTCSAQLARLGDRGVVQVAGGTARRKQYYLTERLYNIYYLLRRRRGPDRLVEALIHFMESYYSPPELKDISDRMVRDAGSLGAEMGSLHQIALASLVELPSLARYREELLAAMPASGRTSSQADEQVARALFKTARDLQNRGEEAVAAYDDIIRRFGDSGRPAILEWVAKALVNKGAALAELDRPQDALDCYGDVVRRFGESDSPALLESVAAAIVNEAVSLGTLNRPQDAMAATEEVVRRFGESDSPALLESVAAAIVNRGVAFEALNRPQDALEAYDRVLHRFGDSEIPVVEEWVAAALLKKGSVLVDTNRTREALKACDEVVHRFGESEAPHLLESVAVALINRGGVLGMLNRPEDVLEVCDEVVRRFGESEAPAFLISVATAFVNKGAALAELNRPQEALQAWDEVVRRFEKSEGSALQERVATALVNRGGALGMLNRPEDTLEACDEIIRRFGESETPTLLTSVATALVNRGNALGTLNRPQEALKTWDEVVRRFGESDSPAVLERVGQAQVAKGVVLRALNRPQDALKACDEVVNRFGRSAIPALQESVAAALVNKGMALMALDRPQLALELCEEVVRRFGEREIPAVTEWIAKALVHKGAVLNALNRPQDALDAYDEVVRRFGKSDASALRESVATALVNKGVALAALNRPQDTLEVCNEVVRRFGESESPALLTSCATALVNKGGALGVMDQPKEALEVCDEVVRRFGASAIPAVLERVATALTNRGAVLHRQDRPDDALNAYDEVVRRFAEGATPTLGAKVKDAQLGRAGIEIENRQFETAARTAGRAIEHPQWGTPEQQVRGRLIRAKALLALGERSAGEQDVEAVLALPELSRVSRDGLMGLIDLSVAIGSQRMHELIQASPSAPLLAPLTTTLERELGREPRVAREVDEVARDIQRRLATLRARRGRRLQGREGDPSP